MTAHAHGTHAKKHDDDEAEVKAKDVKAKSAEGFKAGDKATYTGPETEGKPMKVMVMSEVKANGKHSCEAMADPFRNITAGSKAFDALPEELVADKTAEIEAKGVSDATLAKRKKYAEDKAKAKAKAKGKEDK